MNQKCRLPDSHRLWCAFPSTSATSIQSDVAALQPRIGRNQPGLGSSPFARHYLGNHCYFLFLQVLRCFSSLRLPLWVKPISSRIFHARGCPIRKSRDERVCASTPGLSQLIASFVASETLGIPRVLLLTSWFVTTLVSSCITTGKRATLRFCYPLRQRTCITLIFSDSEADFLLKSAYLI